MNYVCPYGSFAVDKAKKKKEKKKKKEQEQEQKSQVHGVSRVYD